ncbi:MAG: RraA family protein [Sedimentisphaerales bacterium]|nr:RraA family protein [Sedimentisphaerales bacterium]
MLLHSDLLELKRWNTPTIYNGWEQITHCNPARDGFNLEETRDYMPQMGPMVGYAVTVVCEPSNARHKENPSAFIDYFRYLASKPGPKIAVVQDLDKPQTFGSFWGEVTANIHKSLRCVGTIVDGAVRDVDEMTNAGFKALARRLCVGHAHSWPVRWDCEVEVFGRTVRPGQLIHADKHGFLVINEEDQAKLLGAARFMDANECQHLISAARSAVGKPMEEILREIEKGFQDFRQATADRFHGQAEF